MNMSTIEHQVKVVGNAAYSVARTNVHGKYKDNDNDINTFSLETLVLQKVSGEWKIVHIH